MKRWKDFEAYYTLIVGLAAITEMAQDTVRMDHFLESIGYPHLDAVTIRSWGEDQMRSFMELREHYFKEREQFQTAIALKKMEEEAGKHRRQSLIKQEQKKRRQLAVSMAASLPAATSGEVSQIVDALVALGDRSVTALLSGNLGVRSQENGIVGIQDSPEPPSEAVERPLQDYEIVLWQYVYASKSYKAGQLGVEGAVWLPRGNFSGQKLPLPQSLWGRQVVTIAATFRMGPQSDTLVLVAAEYEEYNFQVAVVGNDFKGIQGFVTLVLEMESEEDNWARDWSLGFASAATGTWHHLALVLDMQREEAILYLDGEYAGRRLRLEGFSESSIFQEGTLLFVGPAGTDRRSPRLNSPKDRRNAKQVSKEVLDDFFIWGRRLEPWEVQLAHQAMGSISGVAVHKSASVEQPRRQTSLRNAAMKSLSVTAIPGHRRNASNGAHSPSGLPPLGQAVPGQFKPVMTLGATSVTQPYSSVTRLNPRRNPRPPPLNGNLSIEDIEHRLEEISRKLLMREAIGSDLQIKERFKAVEAAVKTTLLATGKTRFTDLDFPPDGSSIFVDPSKPLTRLKVVEKWARAAEIVKARMAVSGAFPELFAGQPNASDVCQVGENTLEIFSPLFFFVCFIFWGICRAIWGTAGF